MPAFTFSNDDDCDLLGDSQCRQFILVYLSGLMELDPEGRPVAGRSIYEVLDRGGETWSVTDVSIGTPPVAAHRATFRMPVPDSMPTCPGNVEPLHVPSNGSATFEVIVLPSGATNLTEDGLQSVELLSDNAKWNFRVVGWPFCSGENKLMLQFYVKTASSYMLPQIKSSQEILQDMEHQLEDFVGSNDTTAAQLRSDSMASSGDRRPGYSYRERARQKLEELDSIPSHAREILMERFVRNRAIQGLGTRDLTKPSKFLFFPPSMNATDRQPKIDTPEVAVVDGTERSIGVQIFSGLLSDGGIDNDVDDDDDDYDDQKDWEYQVPSSDGLGESVAIIEVTVPAFENDVVYDPVATVSSNEMMLQDIVDNTLDGPEMDGSEDIEEDHGSSEPVLDSPSSSAEIVSYAGCSSIYAILASCTILLISNFP